MKYNKNFVLIVIIAIIIGALVISGGVIYFNKKPQISLKNTKEDNYPLTNQNISSKNPPISTDKKTTTPIKQKDYKALCNDDSMCLKYFDIWKKEQFSRNGYTQSYFDEHIIPESMTVLKWNSGESFSIIYYIKIDWALIKTNDGFLVKLNPNEDTFQYLNIPKNTYLDKSNIDIIIDKLAFNSDFTFFKPIDNLYYKSQKDVLNAIRVKEGKEFEFSDIRYISDRPRIEKGISVPILEAFNSSNCSQNKSRVADVNLITGEITISDRPCYID